ncbi:PD-(D/E)XK nuclease family protein [uncultured Microscilla sp.]|uniref:PD-(D/E)XK nuclease family protein n=1 Tax=uncultured Microscilla sp. TaxID=432653 RepID=UPI00260816F6|nr:PD-(D/E)XK nuclease family protein [uncultured Microscilla sp.]
MQAFLHQCITQLIDHHGTEGLKGLCVVMPTRRSCHVLRHFMVAQEVDAEDFPTILTIDDFVTETTKTDTSSAIVLLLELYDVFRKIDPEIKLEKFTSWGYVLLKDFEQIDRNLVDAKKLFSNLSDIKNIERWNLGEQQVTTKISRYFKLWENLQETYTRFQERLTLNGQAYMGMLYRRLANEVDELLIKPDKYDQFVFIGFNALTKSEESIFKQLVKKGKAEVFWDTDNYYMREDIENKAGMFLKQYKKNWAGNAWSFQGNHLQETKKEVQVISVANASLQGRATNQLLENWAINPLKANKNGQGTSGGDTAIVLSDENVLVPLIHSLSKEYAGMNITMGLALRNSALFNLVDALFEQNQTKIRVVLEQEEEKEGAEKDQNATDDPKPEKVSKFSYRSIIKLLNHPFIRQFERKIEAEITTEGETRPGFIQEVVRFINKNNQIFLSQAALLDFTETPLFKEDKTDDELARIHQQAPAFRQLFEILFSSWKNALDAIACFEQLMELLNFETNQFEIKYAEQFREILNDLKFFIRTRRGFISIHTFKIFLYQAFREAKVAFDSEKSTSLQVLSLVETRNIDFDNVILLSVNETILPKGKKSNSFIPFDISQSYGLPTYVDQEAMLSYHFYRLLQRAKKVAILHVSPSDTYGGYEKSRLLLQLQHDLSQYNPEIKVKNQVGRFRKSDEYEEQGLVIQKNTQVMDKLMQKFKEGLSPWHINAFISCSLKYYFNQIAEIGNSIVVEESLGADKFGSIVHEILEDIYRELSAKHKEIEAPHIEAELPEVQNRVNEKFLQEEYANYLQTGENFITKKLATNFVTNFLKNQAKEAKENGAPFEILSLENKNRWTDPQEAFSPVLSAQFEAEVNGQATEVKIKGITDRIDKIGEKVRIIDYKTGLVEKKDVKLSNDDLERLVSDTKADKVRQLWLYKYILSKLIIEKGEYYIGEHKLTEKEPISAGIYSLRNLKEGLLELKSSVKDQELFSETLHEYVHKSEMYLQEIIHNMADETQPIERTPDINTCVYCAYKGICGR